VGTWEGVCDDGGGVRSGACKKVGGGIGLPGWATQWGLKSARGWVLLLVRPMGLKTASVGAEVNIRIVEGFGRYRVTFDN
jgi:hypothetical protein